MQFLKSIISNREGTYNILGNEVLFTNKYASFSENELLFTDIHPSNSEHSQKSNPMKKFAKRIGAIAFHAFVGMHERTNILIHELSHALVARLFSGQNSKILIFMNPSNPGTDAGLTIRDELDSPWKNTMMCAAGHMGGVAFEICTIAAVIGMKKHIPISAYRLLGLGAIVGLSLEFGRIVKSFTHEEGDFANIAKHGKLPLVLTSSVLAGECMIASALALSAYCQSVREFTESIVAHQSKSNVTKTSHHFRDKF